MQHLLISFLLLLTLSGCGDEKTQADHNTKTETTKPIQKSPAQRAMEAKAEKDALLAELKAKNLALEKVRKENQEVQAKLLAQEEEKKEAFLKAQVQKEKEQKEIARNKKLSQVGIQVENNTITIDTNKTKDFFKQIGLNFEDKIKKITQDLEKDVIDQKEAGIHIDESNIHIDFNKTKNFLEKWGQKMQGFVNEFDTMAKDIDANLKKIDDHIKEIENQ